MVLSRNLVESYALEIISRSRSISDNCEFLLTHDYSTTAPKNFARTIANACNFLSEAVIAIIKECHDENIENTINLLRNTDFLIKEIGAHVRYIDGARAERLPWSIIPAFKKLAKKLLPNIQIMLRPQWKYNYSVDLTDMRLAYHEALREYKDYVPDKNLNDDILGNLTGSFHLISFPFSERKNILLHPLLGHEIGHLFADRYLTKEKRDEFSNNVISDIQSKVENEFKGQLPEDHLFRKIIIENEKNNNLQVAIDYWVRGLEELISDIVCAILFGPAAIFASLELAIPEGFDRAPSSSNNFYPPWRMRLREILKILDNYGGKYFPIGKDVIEAKEKTDKLNQSFEKIRELIKDETDRKNIENNPIAKIAYQQIKSKYLSDSTRYLIEDCKLKDHLITSTELYKNLNHLIKRLDNGIPPNAIENSAYDRHPAKLVEIINASWFHKISWKESLLDEKNFNENIYALRNRMNNLTLKAIEYSYIEDEYIENMEKL